MKTKKKQKGMVSRLIMSCASLLLAIGWATGANAAVKRLSSDAMSAVKGLSTQQYFKCNTLASSVLPYCATQNGCVWDATDQIFYYRVSAGKNICGATGIATDWCTDASNKCSTRYGFSDNICANDLQTKDYYTLTCC